jgi:hypothetical protein
MDNSDLITPQDRDAMVRTVIGEAGDQGPEGQAAVANVILNRWVSGRYGSTPTAVVLAPNQFEPWSTRQQELLSYDPKSPQYQKTGSIVDAVVNGDVPDATNGSTHFLQKDTVLQRRGSLPAWAKQPVAQIGAHTFYAPEGKSSASDALDAINDAVGATPSSPQALAFSGSDTNGGGDMLRAAGFTVPGTNSVAAASPPAQAPAPSPAGSSMLEAAGFKLPSKLPEDPAIDSGALTASASAAAAPVKQGRGIWQALKDYPGHLLDELVDTVKFPSDVLNSTTPVTSEQLIPGAVGIAGLAEGTRFPKIGASEVATAAAKTSAINKMVDAIGPENVPAAVDRMQANPRLSPVDVSDTVRTLAQGLIDPAQPKAQNAIVSAVKSRTQSAAGAVNDAYTANMGAAPDVLQMVEGLKDRAREAGQKAIQPALENAKPVDISPVLSAIDQKLQPGINALTDPKTQLPLSDFQQELARLKQQLVTGSGEQLFDAQRLHRVQSDVGDQAYQLSTSPNPKDRLLGSQLRGINEQLIDQIDEASGGTYRPARQNFKDAKDISEAFESGFDTLKNRQGLTGATEDSPAALQQWKDQASPEEVVARRLGTRADIDQKIRTAKNQALAGEGITRIEYNRDKLGILFGDQEASRLTQAMEDARAESATNAKLIAGSKTAETTAAQKALEVPKVTAGNPLQLLVPMGAEFLGENYGLPGVGMGALLGAKGLQLGVRYAQKQAALARNAAFARASVASGPERNILLERLMAHPKVRAAAGQ